MAREIGAITTAAGAPSLDALLTAIRAERPGERELDALSRRVLCNMLEARGMRRDVGKAG
jgi:hypothetical protein